MLHCKCGCSTCLYAYQTLPNKYTDWTKLSQTTPADVAVGHNSIVWPSNRRAFCNSYLSPLSHNWEVCQGFPTFLYCCQSEGYVRLNVFCSCFFFIIVAIYGDCSGLYNYLWFGTWLVWQYWARPLRRRKPASSLVWHFPSWRIRLWSFYGRLSECEFVSCSCRRLCLHSLKLEDMPQFLAI